MAPAPRSVEPEVAPLETLGALIGRRELGMHYQARIDLRAGEIVGLEAQSRWARPGSEWVDVQDLLNRTEDDETIAAFSGWLIREVADQTRDLFARALSHAVAAMVVTPVQLATDRTRQAVATALRLLGPIAARLEVLARPEDATMMLAEFAPFLAAGGSLTLDVGQFDPWAFLAKPAEGAQRLKISLRSPFATDETLARLVCEADARGLELLGADVESADDLSLLKHAGVQQGQGAFLHKACTAEELIAQVRSGQL